MLTRHPESSQPKGCQVAHTVRVSSSTSNDCYDYILQYSTVQYSTAQYSTVQYSTVQYSTVQYSTGQYSTVQYSRISYHMHASLISKHFSALDDVPCVV
jgi:hypothetical protein